MSGHIVGSTATQSYFVFARQFGAKGDGVTDDRAAIEAALAWLNTAGGGELKLGRGSFLVTQHTTDLRCGIDFNGYTNIIVSGEGRGATKVIHTQDYSTAWRGIFRLTDCNKIQLRDFTIDGRWTNEAGDEQIHGIEMSGAAGAVTDCHVTNVEVIGMRGDGVRFQGTATDHVSRCSVTYSWLYTNKRAAVTGQLCTDYIEIGHNYMESGTDSVFDIETSSPGPSPLGWKVHHNRMVNVSDSVDIAASFTGISDYLEDFEIYNNDIVDGCVEFVYAKNCRFYNNRVVERNDSDGTNSNIGVSKSIGIEIYNNYINRPASAVAGNCIEVAQNDSIGCSFIDIHHNRVEQYTAAAPVRLSAVSQLRCLSNWVDYYNADATIYGISVNHSLAGTNYDIDISYNHVRGSLSGGGALADGVRVAPQTGVTLYGVVTVGNAGSGCTNGVNFQGNVARFGDMPCVQGNGFVGATTQVNRGVLTYYQTGGTRGGVGEFLCNGTPEAVIAAPVGSQCQRSDGGAGTSLYVKESGTGNTGWAGK